MMNQLFYYYLELNNYLTEDNFNYENILNKLKDLSLEDFQNE
jgi:hypothetical protein